MSQCAPSPCSDLHHSFYVGQDLFYRLSSFFEAIQHQKAVRWRDNRGLQRPELELTPDKKGSLHSRTSSNFFQLHLTVCFILPSPGGKIPLLCLLPCPNLTHCQDLWFIFVCVCVCVCLRVRGREKESEKERDHLCLSLLSSDVDAKTAHTVQWLYSQ